MFKNTYISLEDWNSFCKICRTDGIFLFSTFTAKIEFVFLLKKQLYRNRVLIYNVVLISDVQQSKEDIYIISPLFWILFLYRSLQNIE